MIRMFILTSLLLAVTACTSNPDVVRQRTANATETIKQDSKAMAQGIAEGIKRPGPININTASRDQLLTLPDLTGAEADRIIADRPFDDSTELLHRHVVSRAEYDKISGHVTTK